MMLLLRAWSSEARFGPSPLPKAATVVSSKVGRTSCRSEIPDGTKGFYGALRKKEESCTYVPASGAVAGGNAAELNATLRAHSVPQVPPLRYLAAFLPSSVLPV